ncbi:MAG: monofunctional biosynthetic peptidoglycan transglycosylase [Gemmatimonadota bacterium]|nr:monofunctional biosynthetic peptidoglycan transglycosylase [Gemmatimonadota bacterium]
MSEESPQRGPSGGCCGCIISLPVVAGLVWILFQYATWPDVKGLAESNPESTAFIQAYDDGPVDWRWVSYESISSNLGHAIIVSEDGEFFDHMGFSAREIRAAIEEAVEEKEAPRGASTMTQQLAKNLWLSPSRNPVRKIQEGILAGQLEGYLDKRRILEIYLNVVEFGPGIYGAEAAARRFFDKAASELTQWEAALLAASLPRPKSWNPDTMAERYVARARRIERVMRITGNIRRRVENPSRE